MNPKLLIGIIILICLFFAVGLGVGLGQDNQASPNLTDADWLKLFEDWLPANLATIDDIDAVLPPDCLQTVSKQLVVPAGGSCQLIWTPNSRQRTLELEMRAGNLADLELIQPVQKDGDTLTNRQEDLTVGSLLQLDIYRQQTAADQIQLTISCHSGDQDNCLFRFP